MSSLYLADPGVVQKVGEIWRNNPRLGFTRKFGRVIKFYKEFCLRKAAEWRIEETRLCQHFGEVTVNLHRDSLNEDLQRQLGGIGEQLRRIESRQAEGQRIRSRVKWKSVGDSCTKKFFCASKSHSSASNITALEDDLGTLHCDQPRLERVCSRFYQTLYMAAAPSAAATEAATARAFENMSDRLTPGMKASLREPVSMKEFDRAVVELVPGKAPGPDEVLTEFYKAFWPLTRADYFTMINEVVLKHRLLPGITRGLISFLQKDDSRTRLTNWRLITLLNIAYKVYAKAL